MLCELTTAHGLCTGDSSGSCRGLRGMLKRGSERARSKRTSTARPLVPSNGTHKRHSPVDLCISRPREVYAAKRSVTWTPHLNLSQVLKLYIFTQTLRISICAALRPMIGRLYSAVHC